MKRKITNLLVGLLFLVGLGVLTYPTISNQWNTYRQSKLISTYEAAMDMPYLFVKSSVALNLS